MRIQNYVGVAIFAAMIANGASAQKLGVGGVGVDQNTSLPKCDKPLGTIALVEKKVADQYDKLPEGIRALAEMADAQENKKGPTRVDPVPLVKLMAGNSGCFTVAERGEAFDAVKRERELAGLGEQKVVPASHVGTVTLIYSDANSKGAAGGAGGGFGSAVGLKSKTLESQVMLSLTDIKTGLQTSVATGSARKKDLNIVGGGLFVDLGIAVLGGAYSSTDIGKITALATLDAFRNLVADAQAKLAGTAPTNEDTISPIPESTE